MSFFVLIDNWFCYTIQVQVIPGSITNFNATDFFLSYYDKFCSYTSKSENKFDKVLNVEQSNLLFRC